MDLTHTSAKARALHEARRTRTPIAPFTDSEPDLTLADGYAVQQELVRLLLADGETVTGYKVGLTSMAMQEQLGVDSPDFGPVLASTRYADQGTVRLGDFIAPRVEAEIVFVVGQRLAGPGVTVEDAGAAITGAMAAMEVIDSRIVDWRIRLADTVADLASNGAFLTSGRLVPHGGTDWRDVAVTLTRNGEPVARGSGAAALGDPVAVVAWLANVLGENGVALQPGQIVMTGALHAAVPMAAGDQFRADFDVLGPVTLHVEADRAADDAAASRRSAAG